MSTLQEVFDTSLIAFHMSQFIFEQSPQSYEYPSSYSIETIEKLRLVDDLMFIQTNQGNWVNGKFHAFDLIEAVVKKYNLNYEVPNE